MKKFSLLLSLGVTAFFFACGDDSGSNSETNTGNSGNTNNEDSREVESIKDLSRCSDEREGDTVYVADQMRDYLCHNHAWIDLFELLEETNSSSSVSTSSSSITSSSSSTDENEAGSSSSTDESETDNSSSSGKNDDGSSSSTGENETDSSSSIDKSEDNNSSSSDKNEADSSSSSGKNEDSSSSSTDKSEVVKPITDLSITGIAQKGPFTWGSKVTVRELKETLSITGRSFEGTVTGWNGAFNVSKVSFISPYALLEVKGSYRNEVDGSTSNSTITLNAYADLSDPQTVCINVLTHLEYYRVRELMANDRTLKLKDAKKQAKKEIFEAFGIDATNFDASEDLNIFGTSDQSAALLAMSILLQGDRNEAILTTLLTTLGKDIAKDGRWDDAETRATIADWAARIDLGLKGTVTLSKIRSEMTSWGVGNVPAFEKYIRDFWYNEYGLGTCDESNKDEIKRDTNSHSVNYNKTYFVCLDNRWVQASSKQYNTVHFECNKNGELLKGLVDTSWYYTCDADTFKLEGNTIAIFLEKSCNDYTKNSDVISSKNGTKWTCRNGNWEWDNNAIIGVMTDNRDGKVYQTTTIATQTWMAENLTYSGVRFYRNNIIYGKLYLWSTAMDSAGVFSTAGKGCGFGKTCAAASANSNTVVRGICPEGWHLPNTRDWSTLLTAIGGGSNAGTKLKSTNLWNSSGNGTDDYGFSVLPAGYITGGGFYGDYGSDGYFWSSIENGVFAYAKNFSYKSSSVLTESYHKQGALSIRCVKD